jgi:hypothetical protein
MHPASRAVVAALVIATATGATARPLVVRDAPRAHGDADGDGRIEYAVVVEPAPALRRAPVFVAVFEERVGGWTLVAAIRLENGARVERLRLAPGVLTASFRRHYPIDPPCCPSRETVRSYAVVDGTVVGDAVAIVTPAWAAEVAALIPR